MKKNVKTIAAIFGIVLSANIFTGCITMAAYGIMGAVEIGKAVVEIGGAINEAAEEAREVAREEDAATAAGRKRTLNEIWSNLTNNDFDNPAEERLTRRTSSLTGMPVDVSPYLLHENSFIVIEDAIQYCGSVIEINTRTPAKKENYIFEFDITVTYQVNKQEYQNDVTVAVYGRNESQAKTSVRNYMRQYAAQKLGLNTSNLRRFNVNYNNTRRGNSTFTFGYNNVFVQEIERCYYQFDVEVEYLRTTQGRSGHRYIYYAMFDKVYRSDLRCAAAAAIDVQVAVWQDARANGLRDASPPLPIINFVRVAKFTQ